jgi:hypothetical protein
VLQYWEAQRQSQSEQAELLELGRLSMAEQGMLEQLAAILHSEHGRELAAGEEEFIQAPQEQQEQLQNGRVFWEEQMLTLQPLELLQLF